MQFEVLCSGKEAPICRAFQRKERGAWRGLMPPPHKTKRSAAWTTKYLPSWAVGEQKEKLGEAMYANPGGCRDQITHCRRHYAIWAYLYCLQPGDWRSCNASSFDFRSSIFKLAPIAAGQVLCWSWLFDLGKATS